jgi:hypothetical protein
LCNIAVKLFPGASKVVDCVKKEGGFNRVFILAFDTGNRAVAKLPTRIAGPPRLATNSQVATMEYCMTTKLISKGVYVSVHADLDLNSTN